MTVALRAKQSVLILTCLIIVSACSTKYLKPTSSYTKEAGLSGPSGLLMERLPTENENIRGGREFNEIAAKEQSKGEVFRKAKQPWIGAKAIPVREGERLPDVFYEKIVFNHSDIDASWTLDILANRLSKLTKMPVRILPDAYTSLREKMGQQDSSDVATEVNETPPEMAAVADEEDAPEVSKSKPQTRSVAKLTENAQQKIVFAPALLKWNGSLKGFLTHISDRLDLNWTYQDGGIVFSRYVVETFEVAQFPFESAYKISSGATSSSGKGASAAKSGTQATPSLEMKFSEEGNLEYFDSTIKILRSMIASAPGSELYISDATGKVVVKSSRFILSQIRDFLRAENASMMRQVVIQVDIYSININDSKQFSVNWSSVYQKIFSGVNGSLVSNKTAVDVGDVSMASFQLSKGSTIPATVVIESLRSEGFSVQHRPVSLIAMNRQWARKSRLAVTNYLAETTPAQGGSGVGGGVGVPGLKQSSLVVGDQLAMMPFILENNTVLLKFGFSLSDLVSLEKIETGSGETRQSLQTPRTTSVSDQFTVAIKPGELMAITGLSKNNITAKRNTLADDIPLIFGGSEKNSNDKEQLLVLMRVVLM
ncbi:MAG: hypothetical protein LW629_05445 [Burkholderiales bacterium]|nr:hypothetical protein [Burkholderiales bacterium]